MARYPDAEQRIIPPGPNDPPIDARMAILHVDAGNASSLYNYFKNRSGGVESHFYVKKNGVVEQYRDTNRQADANREANDFAVSIETQGYGGGKWNDRQLAAIKDLLLWLGEVEGIPLRKADGPHGFGVGYHVQFGAPGPWTSVNGKTCPGPKRINQFDNILVPWMASGGDDMPLSNKDLNKIAEAVWGRRLKPFGRSGDKGWKDGKRRADYLLRETHADRFSADTVPVPDDYADDNPHYRGKYALEHTWKQTRATLQMVQKLAQQSGVDVDEDEIAAAVLAGMKDTWSPAQIAEQVREVLGDDFSQQVVDELSSRLSQ